MLVFLRSTRKLQNAAASTFADLFQTCSICDEATCSAPHRTGGQYRPSACRAGWNSKDFERSLKFARMLPCWLWSLESACQQCCLACLCSAMAMFSFESLKSARTRLLAKLSACVIPQEIPWLDQKVCTMIFYRLMVQHCCWGWLSRFSASRRVWT